MIIERERLAQALYEVDMALEHTLGDWIPWDRRREFRPPDYLVAHYRGRAEAVLRRLGASPMAATMLPRLPWNVLWVNGRSYLIDADGRKIATLLGAPSQREAVAAALIDAFGEPGEKTP